MLSRSLVGVALALGFLVSASAAEVEQSPRALFEAGKYQQVVDVVMAKGDEAQPAELYLAGHSLSRLDRPDEARDAFRRLDRGDEADPLTFVSRSAIAVLDGNSDAALEHARKAGELGPEHFHAQYQLGLVLSLKDQFAEAAATLEKATQIDGNDAYAHYYAGLAYNKVRRTDKMVVHLRAFATLAPHAPERPQVQTILKTIR